MIPAAFAYARADSVDEAIALLAEHGDDAKLLAGGHSLLPLMKLRLATPSVLVDVGRLDRPLLRPRRAATTIAIGGLTRHHDVETDDAPARARAAAERGRGRGRRPAGASPRHARRFARPRRSRVRPARGRARARRHDRRARARRRARDRGRRLLPGLPRDRARARRDDHRGPGAARPTAPAGRSRSSTGAPRTGRSSASPRWAATTPGVALVNMGSTPVRADGGRGARCATARRRPTPRPPRATAPSHRPTSTPRPSSAGTWRGCSSGARSRPSPTHGAGGTR